MSLGILLSISNRIGQWRQESNPFRTNQPKRLSPFVEVKPVDLRPVVPELSAVRMAASQLPHAQEIPETPAVSQSGVPVERVSGQSGRAALALPSRANFMRKGLVRVAVGTVCCLLVAGVGGYGMLQVRHKRELLASGREIKRLENELGKALQENQLLRAYLAAQRAAQARPDAQKAKAKPVAHVRTK